MEMADLPEYKALDCAARLGAASALDGARSVKSCAPQALLQAFVTLVARYEPSWAVDVEDLSESAVRHHLVRCLHRMELGHLARSTADLDASSDGLPVILSAVHDKLDARFGAKLLRRPSRRTRHGSVSDKENARAAPAPSAPGPLPPGMDNPFQTSKQLMRTPPSKPAPSPSRQGMRSSPRLAQKRGEAVAAAADAAVSGTKHASTQDKEKPMPAVVGEPQDQNTGVQTRVASAVGKSRPALAMSTQDSSRQAASTMSRSSPLRRSTTASVARTPRAAPQASTPAKEAAASVTNTNPFSSRSHLGRTPLKKSVTAADKESTPQRTPAVRASPRNKTAGQQSRSRSGTPGATIAPGEMRAPDGLEITGADEEYMGHLNRVKEFNDLRDQLEKLLAESRRAQAQSEQLDATAFKIADDVETLSKDLAICRSLIGAEGETPQSPSAMSANALPDNVEAKLEEVLATLQRQVAETRGKIVNEQARLQELRCQRQELADSNPDGHDASRSDEGPLHKLVAQVNMLEENLAAAVTNNDALQDAMKQKAASIEAAEREAEHLRRLRLCDNVDASMSDSTAVQRRFEILVERTELHVERTTSLKALDDIFDNLNIF